MMKLYTETTGSGPDLVLLHGWGMNLAVWSVLIEPLSRHFRVTVIELPGHGASDYGVASGQFEDWVDAVLEAAPEQATWIGWSLGGQVAMRAAVKAPQRVERLVMLTSSPRFVQDDGWRHAMDQGVLRQFAGALVKDPAQTLGRFLALQVQGDDASRETLRILRQDIAARPAPDPRALEDGLEMLLTVDLRGQLSALSCPVLWLLGARDTLTPAAAGKDIQALMPAARVTVLPGAAHAPFLSHPEACMSELNGFLGVTDE